VAPTGTTRKSRKASPPAACRPPLMMLTIGTGSTGLVPAPRCRQRGRLPPPMHAGNQAMGQRMAKVLKGKGSSPHGTAAKTIEGTEL
jgi:hypothetical protein